jgi:hypothetical protein
MYLGSAIKALSFRALSYGNFALRVKRWFEVLQCRVGIQLLLLLHQIKEPH